MRVTIHLKKTSLSSTSLFQNLMMYLACTEDVPHLYCISSLIAHIVYRGQNMQLHSYTLYTIAIFLKNLWLTTRLYVSLYQSADKGCQRNYFHHYLRKTILFFSKISEKLKKKKNSSPFSEKMGTSMRYKKSF